MRNFRRFVKYVFAFYKVVATVCSLFPIRFQSLVRGSAGHSRAKLIRSCSIIQYIILVMYVI
jgi:hypothetical protein